MSPRRHGPRSTARWLALLAILVLTFAPSITGWLSATHPPLWDQVCSATAPTAAGTAATDDGPPAEPHAFEHCPYCALHADLAPPPDARQVDAGTPLAFRAVPAAFVHAPRANAVRTSAQPRAPPSVA